MVEQKKINLHGIVGTFDSPTDLSPQTRVAFGGYFKEDPEAGTVYGELIDVYGSSVIEGELTEGEFTFLKTYVDQRGYGQRPPIAYNLKRHEGVWAGTYSGSDVVSGETECQTNLVNEDAYPIVAVSTQKPLK